MGLFSKMKKLAEESNRETEALKSAGSLGEVAVPGETKLDLPAGKVRVTYSQQPIELKSYDEWKWERPEVDLRVQGPGGEQISVERPQGSMVVQDPGGPRRSLFATIEIPDSGEHSIWTEPQNDWYEKPGLDPSLLFDPGG